MTFNITAEVSLRGTYAGALSQKAAKALCEGWLDPDESWADQAEDTITTALENELEEILRERLYLAFPQGLVAEIDGVKLALKLEGDEGSVELEGLEVNS